MAAGTWRWRWRRSSRRHHHHTSLASSFEYAPAPFSTPYTVKLSVIDSSFNTLTSKSASITTKKPQSVDVVSAP